MKWTVKSFCEYHGACEEQADIAIARYGTAWEGLPADDLIWAATRPGVLDHKTQRLFACWSVRQVWHLLTDKRSRTAVEVSERFANGDASDSELAAAWSAARAASESADAADWSAARAADWAASAADWSAASAAAWAADIDAAWSAARAAARAVARAAARSVDRSVARAAARAVDWSAACAAQAQWLRENAAPNFNAPTKLPAMREPG
jgi:hypothetical protein